MYALRLVPTVGLAVVALLISACHLGGLTAAQPALFVLSAECAGTFRDRLAAWQETADCAPAGARSQGPLWPGARPRITPSTEDTDCSPPETLVPETCELTEPMDGQAFYVAYVLPVDVPDPEVPVVIGLEATCERTTRELKVVDGAVIAAFEAPARAGCGFVVTAGLLNHTADQVVAGAEGGVDCPDEPCPDEQDSESLDDDDSAD